MSPQGHFIRGSRTSIFLMEYAPTVMTRTAEYVVLAPPFAEEMNRSRRMISLQARSLADKGYGVLIPDLMGTGDSTGDFGEARWEDWLGDLAATIQFAKRKGVTRLSLWAMRFGALLGLDCLRKSGARFERVVLWQPVLLGKILMTQFLRLRFAAGMMDSSKEKESTGDLRKLLQGGNPLEIAGYELAPELFNHIEEAKLEALVGDEAPPLHWFEVVAEEGGEVAAASKKVIGAWRERGLTVTAHTVGGEPFWSLYETTVVPRLVDATTEVFSGTH